MKKIRRRKGVPTNYKAWWGYRGPWKEIKVAPGTWKFKFKAGKQRKGGKGGSHPPGRHIQWVIKARQYVIKRKNRRGKIHYDTVMVGTKKLAKVNYKKPRFYRR